MTLSKPISALAFLTMAVAGCRGHSSEASRPASTGAASAPERTFNCRGQGDDTGVEYTMAVNGGSKKLLRVERGGETLVDQSGEALKVEINRDYPNDPVLIVTGSGDDGAPFEVRGSVHYAQESDILVGDIIVSGGSNPTAAESAQVTCE